MPGPAEVPRHEALVSGSQWGTRIHRPLQGKVDTTGTKAKCEN